MKKIDNDALSKFARSENGGVILNLIREFLSFYHLDFTLSVFNPESRCGIDYTEVRREALVKSLNICGDDSEPLLVQILGKGLDVSGGLNSTYTKAVDDEGLGKVVEEEENEPYSVATERFGFKFVFKFFMNFFSVSETSFKEDESGNITPEKNQNDSINLLMFTPVQEVRTVPKEKVVNFFFN